MILVCDINMFDTKAAIYNAYDDGRVLNLEGELNIPGLVDFVPAYCYSKGISKVVLNGHKEYNQTVAELIQSQEIKLYADNKLEIEVI